MGCFSPLRHWDICVQVQKLLSSVLALKPFVRPTWGVLLQLGLWSWNLCCRWLTACIDVMDVDENEIRKLFQQSFDNFEGTFSWSDLMLLLIPVLMASLILCCISWANNTQLEHQVIALLTTKRQLTSDCMTTDVSDSWWQRPPFCSLARPVQHYATSVLCKTLQNSANRCSTKL